jgi:hypothetical protein
MRRLPRESLTSAAKDLLVVLAVSWAARAAFIAVFGAVYSFDVDYWRVVLEWLEDGRNPYETGLLNWPPLWLVLIVAIDAGADLVGISFLTALRVFLVAVESAVVVALYVVLLAAGAPRSAVRRALLVGIALNPVAILLVCQHGNSDVVVGLFVVLALGSLVAFERSREVTYWLVASLFVGLGVLAKSAPLVLAPVLAAGGRLRSRVGTALGWTLVLGPAALGVGVVLALAPDEVWRYVIRYRSLSGGFGLSGLRDLAAPGLASTHGWLFLAAVAGTLVWLWRRLAPRPPAPPEATFLLAALLLMVVPVFGPGYGPQYAYWYLPALVGTYVLLDEGWRRLLRVAYVIAAVTYVFDYAFVDFLGRNLHALAPGQGWIDRVTGHVSDLDHLTLYRLPLLAVYVLVIVAGARRLARELREPSPVGDFGVPSEVGERSEDGS